VTAEIAEPAADAETVAAAGKKTPGGAGAHTGTQREVYN
jgi:hypothetical protein